MTRKSPPTIDTNKCSGCGRCVAACKKKLITLETSGYRKHAVRHGQSRCECCCDCLNQCPVLAMLHNGDINNG